MADSNTPTPQAPEIKVSEDGFDIGALRAISVAESAQEETQLSASEEADDSQDQSESSEDVEEAADQDDSNGADDTEDAESDAEESGDESDDSESDESEDSEESESKEEKIPQKAAKYLEASKGEKSYKVPLDASVTIPVDGKDTQVTIQNLIKRASGAIHIEKETSKLGRERKRFEEEQSSFHAKADKINENLEVLLNMSDPFEFCTYYASLKGKEPQKVFEEMVQKTISYIDKFQNMTEGERRLEAENRALRLKQRKAEVQAKNTSLANQKSAQRSALERELKAEGLSIDDFHEALDEMRDKVSKGESLGEDFESLEEITPSDVVDYAVAGTMHKRVLEAVQTVNPKLAEETDFISRVKKAIYSVERLHGKLKPSEVRQFVKQALARDKQHLSENLSRKVKLKTTSKTVRSEKKKEQEAPASLKEYLEQRKGFHSLSS